MSSFLTDEQEALASEIATLLTERGETVAVSEGTSGGLVSAALLWVAGACSTRCPRASRSRASRRPRTRTTEAPRQSCSPN